MTETTIYHCDLCNKLIDMIRYEKWKISITQYANNDGKEFRDVCKDCKSKVENLIKKISSGKYHDED